MRLIFDTHAHYDDPVFDEDRETLLRELPAKRVCNVVNMGADLKGCYDSVALAEQYDYIYAAVGIHPGCVNDGLPGDYLDQLEKPLAHPKVVAVGEIGPAGAGQPPRPAGGHPRPGGPRRHHGTPAAIPA